MSVQRANLNRVRQLLVICMALVGSFLLIPAEAEANWNFDPSCSAEEVTELEEPAPPNVYLMLDQSGSMGFLRDPSTGNTLWTVATNAIQTVTWAMNNDVRFGLGLFPCQWTTQQCGWSYDSCAYQFCTWWGCYCMPWWSYSCQTVSPGECGSRTGAAEAVPSDYQNHHAIMDVLDAHFASGGTPTWDAFDNMDQSQSMTEADYSSGGVMITDGVPCCHWNARQDAIDAACNLRGDHLAFVAGLGSATDQDFNHKMAAAVGTGSCTQGDPCENTNVSSSSCTGAFHAYNQTEFQNVINKIGDTLQCTFDVDTSLHVTEEAPDDSGAVRVKMLTASGWQTLEHRNESASGEGWYFPSDGNNQQITLTSYYCNQVQEGDVDTVTTQLACDCSAQEGDFCQVADPGPDECSVGEYICVQGFAQCDPYPIEQCPTACDDLDLEGTPCHVEDDADMTLEEVADGAELGTTLSGEMNRCNIGQVECVNYSDGSQGISCVEALSPMPEVCDGRDNSCSGSTDDIDASWDAFYNGDYPFDGAGWDDVVSQSSDQWQGPTCNETSTLCVCDSPREDFAGSPEDTLAEEFQSYLNDWDPGYCSCSPAVSP